MVSRRLSLLSFILLLSCSPSLLPSENGRSEVRGIITDILGKRVWGATLRLVDEQHHQYEVKTSQDGTYSIHLAPGSYSITVANFGFCQMKRGDFFLKSDTLIQLDFDLVLCSTDLPRKPYDEEELDALNASELKPLLQFGFRKGDSATEYMGFFQQGYYIRPVLTYNVWTLRANSIIYDRFNKIITAEGNIIWQDGKATQNAKYIRILFQNPPQIIKIDP